MFHFEFAVQFLSDVLPAPRVILYLNPQASSQPIPGYRAKICRRKFFLVFLVMAADQFVRTTLLRLSPNCKYLSRFVRFGSIGIKPQALL